MGKRSLFKQQAITEGGLGREVRNRWEARSQLWSRKLRVRVMATETPFVRGALEALHVQGVREDAVNEPLKGLARVP